MRTPATKYLFGLYKHYNVLSELRETREVSKFLTMTTFKIKIKQYRPLKT